MTFSEQQIKDWRAYERVRKGGRYNMITDPRANRATKLLHDQYLFVLQNYEALRAHADRAKGAK